MTKQKATDGFIEHDKDGFAVFEPGLIEIHKDLLKVPQQVSRHCDDEGYIKGRGLHKVSVGNHVLHVETEGTGEKGTVVLVNGGPGITHHIFHPHFSELAKRGYRVVYYDQRGCGLSSKDEDHNYTLKEAVDDLDAIRKQLGVETWSVLGHSYGGLLAQAYADKFSINVNKLLLVSSQFVTNKDKDEKRTYLTKEEHERFQEIFGQHSRGEIDTKTAVFNAYVNGYWKNQSLHKPTKEEIAEVALYEWDHAVTFRDKMCKDLEGYYKADVVFEIPQDRTLIIEGRRDMTADVAKKIDMIREKYPKAGVEVFEESSHHVFEDEPGAFFECVDKFLSKEIALEVEQQPGKSWTPEFQKVPPKTDRKGHKSTAHGQLL